MRTLRLFALLDNLRGRSAPVSAEALAVALDVSVRTIYRDMVTLQAMGAPVRGESGMGYQLEKGFFLPPLHFDRDELDAIMLGMRVVAARGDKALMSAAGRVSAKISGAMEEEAGEAYKQLPLRAVFRQTEEMGRADAHLAVLRAAVRDRALLEVRYLDLRESASDRTLRPLGLTLFDAVWLLTAWCEARSAFRNFRLDRIRSVRDLGRRFRHERDKRFEDYLRTI
jgi:predicted DNA-binding transcriptional regulator YafY